MSLSSSRSRAIFEQAIEIASSAERDSFVREACGQDEELLRAIHRLLEADAEAGGFLAADPSKELPAASVSELEVPGKTIGPYRLSERIGEGGMGVVYRAQQEEPVRRQVALKIIKLGMDTRQVVARFEVERQALALMDHPNIAKILDAGVTSDPHPQPHLMGEGGRRPGESFPNFQLSTFNSQLPPGRPYFVMEFVDGVPITEFCEKNKLTIEQRLQLFMQVCGAVQHAHQKGIIHRDLKPSNVLVAMNDGVPLPKVIDFGVAKATNQKLTDKTLVTQHLVMIGTPAYMSPEQADLSGLDVDTRSDIYSLGVLLYELLTGSPPFPEERLRRVSQSEMQRIIAQEEPERPSTRLKKELASAISGLGSAPASGAGVLPKPRSPFAPRLSPLPTDLDWIVMKCLEKDRNRRYETANALSADLQRFLADEPVVARPPSAAYRFRKAVRRNQLAFVAAGVVALTLCLGVAVSVWQAVRVDRERARAERQLQATLRFINGVFNDVSPDMNVLIGGAAPNRILATSGLRLLEDLSRDAKAQGEFPVVLGRIYLQLAFIHGWPMGNTTGNYAEGLRCANEAIRLLAPSGSEVPDDTRLNELARSEMAAGFAAWGLLDYPAATAHFHQMEAWADRLAQSHEPHWIAQGQVLKEWATGCLDDVMIAIDPRKIPNTITNVYFLGGAEPRRIKTASSRTDDITGWIGWNDGLGSAYARMGQYSNGLPYLQEALQSAEESAQIQPNAAQQASQVAESRAKLGATLLALQQTDEGRTALSQALQNAESLVKRDPANVGFAQLRIRVLALFASGEAAGSSQSSVPQPERRRQITAAETHLDQAQTLLRKLTPESAANFLRPELQRVVNEVAAAKAKLDEGATNPP